MHGETVKQTLTSGGTVCVIRVATRDCDSVTVQLSELYDLYKQGSPLGSETDPVTRFRTAIYRPNDWLKFSKFQSAVTGHHLTFRHRASSI